MKVFVEDREEDEVFDFVSVEVLDKVNVLDPVWLFDFDKELLFVPDEVFVGETDFVIVAVWEEDFVFVEEEVDDSEEVFVNDEESVVVKLFVEDLEDERVFVKENDFDFDEDLDEDFVGDEVFVIVPVGVPLIVSDFVFVCVFVAVSLFVFDSVTDALVVSDFVTVFVVEIVGVIGGVWVPVFVLVIDCDFVPVFEAVIENDCVFEKVEEAEIVFVVDFDFEIEAEGESEEVNVTVLDFEEVEVEDWLDDFVTVFETVFDEEIDFVEVNDRELVKLFVNVNEVEEVLDGVKLFERVGVFDEVNVRVNDFVVENVGVFVCETNVTVFETETVPEIDRESDTVTVGGGIVKVADAEAVWVGTIRITGVSGTYESFLAKTQQPK